MTTYNFETLVLELEDRIDSIDEPKKSLMQANLADIFDDIEKVIFDLKINEDNYHHKTFELLKKRGITTKASIGLVFLSYVVSGIHPQLTYKEIWPVIVKDLEKYETLTTFFRDHYFNRQNNPTDFLIECIEEACERFQLRHAFEHKDDEHYKRNTILLQMGLLNKFTNLNLWLSGYINQKTLSVLLNKDDEFYSSSFHSGWRVLRRYRDNLIDDKISSALLKQNPWFADIDIDEALKASKTKLNRVLLQEKDTENIFFLDKVVYNNNHLQFIIQAEDLYMLELGGSEYSIYIDNKYKGKILRNENKVFELDSPIVLDDAKEFKASLELKNEDEDVVYNDEIALFDLSEQILVFDDQGKIYKNFLNKLPSNRVYTILFDSDLDCDMQQQVEYFGGYATLVSGIIPENNCQFSYNDKILFSLNFTKTTIKPDWIDQLVLVASDNLIKIGEPANFKLSIFDYEHEELKSLPADAEIVRWTNSGIFVDEEDIKDFSAQMVLSPEMVYDRRHAFFIRYENQTYHRVVSAAILDKSSPCHFLYQAQDEELQQIQRQDVLNYHQLQDAQFQVACFNINHLNGSKFIKDKVNIYANIQINKKQQFSKLPKFGEALFMSDEKLHDKGIMLFKVVQQGIVKEYDNDTVTLTLLETPPYLKECEFIVLDRDYQVRSLDKSQYSIKSNSITFDDSYLSIVIQFAGNYIGSIVQYQKIDFMQIPDDEEILKFLYLAYMPLLLMDRDQQKNWIEKNMLTFFKAYLADTYTTPAGDEICFHFNDVNSTIEHLVFDLTFTKEDAQALLGEIITKDWQSKVLKMPILLSYLLGLVKSERYTTYFLDFLEEIKAPLDREQEFIDGCVHDLLHHHDIDKKHQQNLKIAMHDRYGDFYLKQTLKRMR